MSVWVASDRARVAAAGAQLIIRLTRLTIMKMTALPYLGTARISLVLSHVILKFDILPVLISIRAKSDARIRACIRARASDGSRELNLKFGIRASNITLKY